MREAAKLLDLPPGATGTVAGLAADAGLRQRMEALGLRPGQNVQVLRRGWWAGPLHVRVGMTELMLRRRDAARVSLAA
jgi:ferrous iron transport protein A